MRALKTKCDAELSRAHPRGHGEAGFGHLVLYFSVLFMLYLAFCNKAFNSPPYF